MHFGTSAWFDGGRLCLRSGTSSVVHGTWDGEKMGCFPKKPRPGDSSLPTGLNYNPASSVRKIKTTLHTLPWVGQHRPIGCELGREWDLIRGPRDSRRPVLNPVPSVVLAY